MCVVLLRHCRVNSDSLTVTDVICGRFLTLELIFSVITELAIQISKESVAICQL